jgi:hypothetical protein
MANALVGFNPNDTFTSAQSTQGKIFGLGDKIAQHDGKEYVFVLAATAVVASDVVFFVPGTFSASTLSTANDARGNNVGVATVAVNSGEYFWAQVKGACTANVLASCVANVRLNTTATAGKLDDDGTASSMQVQGIYLTATNGGSTAAVAAILNDPVVDVTL